MTKPPPPLFLPLNRDPAHAIEQAIAVLNTIVEKHPEVRRDFDCEAFIHHELAPALEAKRAEAWIEEELKDGDKICEAAGVQRTEGGRLQVAKIIAKLSARPEVDALPQWNSRPSADEIEAHYPSSQHQPDECEMCRFIHDAAKAYLAVRSPRGTPERCHKCNEVLPDAKFRCPNLVDCPYITMLGGSIPPQSHRQESK